MLQIRCHGTWGLLEASDGRRHSSGAGEALRIAHRIAGQLRSMPPACGLDFLSCYGANGGTFSNAQQVANATGRKVTAYYGKTNPLGVNIFSGRDIPSRVFHPQGPFVAKISAFGNKRMAGLAKFRLG